MGTDDRCRRSRWRWWRARGRHRGKGGPRWIYALHGFYRSTRGEPGIADQGSLRPTEGPGSRYTDRFIARRIGYQSGSPGGIHKGADCLFKKAFRAVDFWLGWVRNDRAHLG